MDPHWTARAVAFIGTLFTVAGFAQDWQPSKAIGAILLVVATLLGTGDIEIGRGWGKL